jgi:hypothetical protein
MFPDLSDAAAAVGGGDNSGGADSSGWLSGLGDLFSGIGSAVSSGLKASNVPSVNPGSGWVYNKTTGNYYNPVTGQALTATGTLSSAGAFSGALNGSNGLFLILLVGLGLLIWKRG